MTEMNGLLFLALTGEPPQSLHVYGTGEGPLILMLCGQCSRDTHMNIYHA